MEEELYYECEEHAYSVLHAAYPNTPLSVITEAVMTEWIDGNTDEQNVECCSWLNDYK